MFTKSDRQGLLLHGKNRRMNVLWPHRCIIDEIALLPLGYCLRIEIVAFAQLFDRSLRSLYCRSDGVRRLGAAV